MLGQLIGKIYDDGYECTVGWAYREPGTSEAIGKLGDRSLHCKRLAIDLNLFKDGKYLTSTDAHLPFGVFWESLGGAWGGRFSKGDGNHYSLEHGGVK
jgi:hypothetical protein